MKLCYENKKDIKTAVHVSINITSKKYTSSAIYVKKNCNNNIQINTIYTYISIFITQVNNYTKWGLKNQFITRTSSRNSSIK